MSSWSSRKASLACCARSVKLKRHDWWRTTKSSKLDAEILVVYPGERDHVDEFIKAAQGVDKQQVADVPFPMVLDQKMEAVDYFGIRSKLAHPATYVIDKKGKVQLAYVGNDMSPDRPSVKALLRTLQAAQDQE